MPKQQITSPLTSFGELATAEPTITVAVEGYYGIRSTDVETFTASGGTVGTEDTGTGIEFKAACSSTIGSYGVIRSRQNQNNAALYGHPGYDDYRGTASGYSRYGYRHYRFF